MKNLKDKSKTLEINKEAKLKKKTLRNIIQPNK